MQTHSTSKQRILQFAMTTSSLRCILLLFLYVMGVRSFAPTCVFCSKHERIPTSLSSNLADRLGLNDRFDRWRFLQNLLDIEVESATVNQILYEVLGNALNRKRSGTAPEEAVEIDIDLEKIMEDIIAEASVDLTVFNSIELLDQILPDPQIDEDAHKSSWDTVIELNGRESVKLNESNPTNEWTLSCMKARLLIHYDFLTIGI